MPLLISIVLLLLIPGLILLVRLVHPKFIYYWLIAAAGMLAIWPMVLLSHPRAPLELPLVTWRPAELFPVSPLLLLDGYSWPYAIALVSLCLAIVLTDVVRASEADWLAWTSSMILTALGVVAVTAGNPLTLLLAWAAIDLFELWLILSQIMQSSERERAVIAFAFRTFGILLVIYASMIAQSNGETLSFDNLSPRVNLYMLVAAGLRLGILPLHLPLVEGQQLRRGLGSMIRLAPSAGSLGLLARAASSGVPQTMNAVLLGFCALAALVGSISWAVSKNELDGRPYWILCMASLSLAAALRQQPGACIAYGIAMLLGGGVLFLFSARPRWLTPLLVISLINITTLPYTPSWQAILLYASPFSFSLPIYWVSQVFLLIGYARFALRPGTIIPGAERWIWLIYPLGLVLLPVTHILIFSWRVPLTGGLQQAAISDIGTIGNIRDFCRDFWPALLALLPLALGMAWRQRGLRLPAGSWVYIRAISRAPLSIDWLYRQAWRPYRAASRAISFLNTILEGEGGILWTLLLLTLLVTWLAGGLPGG